VIMGETVRTIRDASGTDVILHRTDLLQSWNDDQSDDETMPARLTHRSEQIEHSQPLSYIINT
jgi:hypothetical protein